MTDLQNHKINFEMLGKKVLKKYPFMAEELIAIPDCKDLSLLPQLYDEYKGIQGDTKAKSELIHYRLMFVAVVIKLYDPDFYEGFRKNTINRLRQSLADALQCHPSSISDYWKTAKSYISIYKEFASELNYIYHELKQFIEEQQKV